jgi:hypothetical protein
MEIWAHCPEHNGRPSWGCTLCRTGADLNKIELMNRAKLRRRGLIVINPIPLTRDEINAARGIWAETRQS